MKSLGTPELQEMISRRERLNLINTLPPNHYQVTRIPGSDNVPLTDADFVEAVQQRVGSKRDPIVVYSADATCDVSTEAAARLENAGFAEVYDYTGGAKAWQAAGGLLASPGPETP